MRAPRPGRRPSEPFRLLGCRAPPCPDGPCGPGPRGRRDLDLRPRRPHAGREGRVLLLVGIRADSPEAPGIVGMSGAPPRGRGHQKRGGEAAAVVAEASLSGLAVLKTADDLPWRHLDGLLVSVLGARRLSAGLMTSGARRRSCSRMRWVGPSVGRRHRGPRTAVLADSSIEGQRIDLAAPAGNFDCRAPDYLYHRAEYLQVLRDPGASRFPAAEGELPRAAVAIAQETCRSARSGRSRTNAGSIRSVNRRCSRREN